MLRRMLFALLITCLAVPAMAAGCVQPAAMAHHDHHKAPAPEDNGSHDCIGCIAPLHGLARVEAPLSVPLSPMLGMISALDSHPLIPDPPPPRRRV